MSANLPPQSPPAVVRPWWAALLTSAIATVLGLGLVLLSVFVVEPAIAVGESNAGWQALLGVGLTLMTVGGSVLAQLAQSLGSSQRGGIDITALLGAICIVAVGAALAVGLATLVSGCALLERREIHTDTAPEVTYGVEDGRCVLRGFTDGHETYTAIGPVGEPCPPVATKP